MMATERTDLDGFSFDDDIFGELDLGIESSKSKSNMAKFAIGFKQGAVETARSPALIKRAMAQALPRGYGTALNLADEALAAGSQLYDIAANEMKPAMPTIRKAVGKLADKSEGVLPNKLQKMLKEFSENGESAYRAPSQEEMDNGAIGEEMASIFGEQFKTEGRRYAADRAERQIRDRIRDKQMSIQMRQSSRMENLMGRLVSYQDKVTYRWQQKTLENSYRLNFMMRDSLILQREHLEVTKKGLEEIAKYSSLPEYKKANLLTEAKDNFRKKLVSGFQNKASDFVSNFTTNLTKNLGDRIRASVGGIAQGIASAGDASSMMEGMDPAEMAGNLAGGGLTDFLMPYLMMPIQKILAKSKRLGKGGASAENIFMQWPEYMQQWAGSATERTGWQGMLEQVLKDTAGSYKRNDVIGESPLAHGDKAVPFNSLSQRSLVEVIPGYLSRMLQELTILRTGNPNTERLVFNMDRGRFTTQSKATSDVKNRLFNSYNNQMTQDQVKKVVDKMDDGSLTEKQRTALAMRLLNDSNSLTPMGADYFSTDKSGRHFDEATRKALAASFKNVLKDKDGKFNPANMTGIIGDFRDIRNRTSDPLAAMQVYRDSGNIELLDALGLVNQEGGRDKANYDQIHHQIMSGLATKRDVENKTPDWLAAKQKEWMGSWERKSEEWADKVTSNRHYQRATGAMGDMFDRAVAWGKRKFAVYSNTGDVILEPEDFTDGLFDEQTGDPIATPADIKGSVVNEEGDRVVTDQELAKGAVDDEGNALSRAASAAKRKLAQTWSKIKTSNTVSAASASIESIGQGYDRGGLEGASKAAGRQGRRFTVGLRRRGRDLFRRARGTRVGGEAAKLYDVYTQDGAEPALTAAKMAAGEYIDQVSGKVIRTFNDIKGPVLDRSGEVILSAKDMLEGVKTSAGAEISELRRKGAEFLEKAAREAGESTLAGKIRNLGRRANAGRIEAQSKLKEAIEGLSAKRPTWNTSGTSDSSLNENVESDPHLKRLQQLVELNEREVELLAELGATISEMGGGSGPVRKHWFDRMVGGAWRGTKSVASGFGKYFSTTFGAQVGLLTGAAKAAFGAVGGLGSLASTMLGKKVMDVYVKGRPDEPALTRTKMKRGDYRDKATGKVIKKIDDIKGAVIDASTPEQNVVLTNEEVEGGIYDHRGKSLLSRGFRVARDALGAFGQYAGMGMFVLPFKAASAAMGLIGSGLGMINEQPDVYLKGQLGKPVLLAKRLKAGEYWSVKRKRPIFKASEVDGEIRDRQGNIVITEEEARTLPLVNWRGKPLRSVGQKILGAGGALAGLAGSAAMGLIKGYTKVIGSVLGMGRDIISGTAKRIGRFFNPEAFSMSLSAKQAEVITDIYKLLKERLPAKKRYRKGSWQEKEELNDKAAEAKSAQEAENERSSKFGLGAVGSWLGGKFKSLFGKSKDDEEGDEGDDDSDWSSDALDALDVFDTFGDWRERRRRRRAEKRKGKGKAPNEVGERVKDPKGKPTKGSRLGRFSRLGGLGRLALGAGGGLVGGYAGSKLADSAMDKLGVSEDSAGRSVGELAGGLGGSYAGVKAASVLGRMVLGGGAVAAEGASAAGLGTAAAGAAGAAEVGAAGAAAAAAGTAGATIGAVLASPVVIGAAAVAAVGLLAYGAYKLYDKYKNDPLRKYRMIQYGINSTDHSFLSGGDINADRESVVRKLEAVCAESLVYGKEGAQLSNQKLNKEAIYDIFGLTPSWLFGLSKRQKDGEIAFLKWFNQRFKPVYLTWMTALKAVSENNSSTTLDDAWGDLTQAQKLRMVNLVSVPDSVYAVGDNPFLGSFTSTPNPLITDPAVIHAVGEETVAAINEKSKSSGADPAKLAQASLAAKAAESKKKAGAKAASDKAAAEAKYRSDFKAQVAAAAAASKLSSDPNYRGPSGTDPFGASAVAYGTAGFGAVDDDNSHHGAVGPTGAAIEHPGNGTGGSINAIPVTTGDGWDNVKATILAAAKMVGVDPQLMATMANIESGFRPGVGAGTSSAKGLYQFINSTWQSMMSKYASKYGIAPGTSQLDGRANALLGAEFLKENFQILRKALGRDPTDTEIYIAHFMGPGGAKQLLTSASSAPAATIFPSQARANVPIFYNNGSSRSVAGVIGYLDNLVKKRRVNVTTGEIAAAKAANDDVGPAPNAAALPTPALASTPTAAARATTVVTGGDSYGMPYIPTATQPAAAARDQSVRTANTLAAVQQTFAAQRSQAAGDWTMRNAGKTTDVAEKQLQTQIEISGKISTLIDVVRQSGGMTGGNSSQASNDASDSSNVITPEQLRKNAKFDSSPVRSPLNVRRSSTGS